jgi:hypothetical protein
VPGPVVLFVLPGSLVLLDDVPLVVVDVDAPDHSDLGSPVSDELVQIKRGRLVLDQRPVRHEGPEVVPSLVVDALVVGIDVRRQIDVRSADVKEAERIARGELGCFGPIDDVVRRRRYPARYGGVGTPALERLETDAALLT